MQFITREFLKEKPAKGAELGFGKYFTDYMFTMKYREGRGWYDGKIEPNVPQRFDLAANVLHYGQGVFEGMKAFLQPDGRIAIFRPDENWARMNRSAERLCIPRFSAETAEKGVEILLDAERSWFPTDPGTSMYIRPAIVATKAALGVHASSEYLFFVLLSPTGNYFKHGLAPLRLIVETTYARAAVGGTGEAKCIGNYAASLLAGKRAEEQGFDQVIWLDSAEKKYVEEAGSMNMFFVIGDEVVTPALNGSILPGITRKSCLQILRDGGYRVSERRISAEEVAEAAESGKLREAFGTGTAAVIAPVGTIRYLGKDYTVGGGKIGEIAQTLFDTVTGIQSGRLPDPYGWRKYIK